MVTRLLLSSAASTGGQIEKSGFGGLPSGGPGQALATANTCVAMLAQLMTGTINPVKTGLILQQYIFVQTYNTYCIL